jgi:hypothetical protein
MRNKLAMMAALAASIGPQIGGAEVVVRGEPFSDWLRANGKLRPAAKKIARSVSSLQLRGWPAIPCDAPEGYFWQRDLGSKMKYRLYKKAPGERTVEYDAVHDRSIIRSGWGYVKPTYAPGDVRE